MKRERSLARFDFQMMVGDYYAWDFKLKTPIQMRNLISGNKSFQWSPTPLIALSLCKSYSLLQHNLCSNVEVGQNWSVRQCQVDPNSRLLLDIPIHFESAWLLISAVPNRLRYADRRRIWETSNGVASGCALLIVQILQICLWSASDSRRSARHWTPNVMLDDYLMLRTKRNPGELPERFQANHSQLCSFQKDEVTAI